MWISRSYGLLSRAPAFGLDLFLMLCCSCDFTKPIGMAVRLLSERGTLSEIAVFVKRSVINDQTK